LPQARRVCEQGARVARCTRCPFCTACISSSSTPLPPPPSTPVALSPHYRRFQQRFNTTRQSVLQKHRGAFTLSPLCPPPSATFAASSSQEGTHVTTSFRAHARPISARGAQRNRASPGGDEKRALIPRGGSSRSFSTSSVSAASSPWPEVFCG